MAEGENPTRRYKWFRPRQAARGAISFASTNNPGNVSLYNNSTGAFYLVVRDFTANFTTGAGNGSIGYFKGALGTPGGIITPLIPDQAPLAGVLNQLDSPLSPVGDYFQAGENSATTPSLWTHDFPFAVLPPGWSLFFQGTAVAPSPVNLYVMWETILADELDFAYD